MNAFTLIGSPHQNVLLYLPTQIRFLIGEERVIGQNFITPLGINNLNFRLARDQVVHF